jgi:ADP-ribose pyrophosphatase
MPKPRVIATKRIYEGKVINLRIDTIEERGRQMERAIVEHRGAVTVVPLDAKGRVLLIRQYRHAAGKRLLELPAGGLDPGEKPRAAAQRELQEEIGYKAAKLESAGSFFTVPGFCEEYMYLFIARGLTPSRLQHDDDEDIKVIPTPLAKVPAMIRSGRIQDAKSIVGLLTVIYLLKHG